MNFEQKRTESNDDLFWLQKMMWIGTDVYILANSNSIEMKMRKISGLDGLCQYCL